MGYNMTAATCPKCGEPAEYDCLSRKVYCQSCSEKRRIVCRGAGSWLVEHKEHGDADVIIAGDRVTLCCPCGERFKGRALIVWDPDAPDVAKA